MIGAYPKNSIVVGDCGNHLHELPDESVTAVLCDPPYGLSKNPDMAEVLRCWMNDEEYRGGDGWVHGAKSGIRLSLALPFGRRYTELMKPGGVVAWRLGGTRTADLLGLALRLAGFEIYDTVMWLYGSG